MNDYFDIISKCVCATGGPCVTQCATEYCVTPGTITTSGDACETCLNTAVGSGGACATQVSSGCTADASCSAYVTCANGCP